jgi:hypothetical protein
MLPIKETEQKVEEERVQQVAAVAGVATARKKLEAEQEHSWRNLPFSSPNFEWLPKDPSCQMCLCLHDPQSMQGSCQ